MQFQCLYLADNGMVAVTSDYRLLAKAASRGIGQSLRFL